jgi:hypothetical protein
MWTHFVIALAVGGALTLTNAAASAAEALAPPMAAIDELPPDQDVSDTVVGLAGWVIGTRDNQDRPFAIMDKRAGQIFVFGADGRLRGAAPALFGSAIGDHTLAGIAERELRDIPAGDRTTPAGRFIGAFGPSIGQGRVLWVDYDTAVSIHPLSTGTPAERRSERLASPSPDDNRITHGCINVSRAFFEGILTSTFGAGGIFYILPDDASLAQTFPGFASSDGVTRRNDPSRVAR